MSKINKDKGKAGREYNYKCTIAINFPSLLQAQSACEVLSVDEEIGNRVIKSLHVKEIEGENNEQRQQQGTLIVDVASSEAKMLRVSVSSFYDMLAVFLKCQQEFQQ
eukprot:CAMPEP_0194085534 /NCGR_PEP_ID=MMETSP0149-20130528/17787_1 /TAXON_ID=122233 /ORGANISM="Chaetoceros debilis, Strain MM31A-1" /LENGTH=106 /DNA_ID=CAMNT_0038768433 /DNA_START=17 /DNA_END=337 /DNA_ORIENTATION=+